MLTTKKAFSLSDIRNMAHAIAEAKRMHDKLVQHEIRQLVE